MAEVHRIVRPPYLPHPQTRLTVPNSYKDTVKDYNFGSLIRTNAHGEYTETNTIFSESLSRLRALPRRVRAVLTRHPQRRAYSFTRTRSRATG